MSRRWCSPQAGSRYIAAASEGQVRPQPPIARRIYVRRFVLGWDKLGLRQSLGSRIVIYADDLVILCRRGKAEEALHWMRELMGKLKLTVNAEKTRICKGSGRGVRLPGVHVRTDVFSENRPGTPGVTAIEEKHPAHDRDDP